MAGTYNPWLVALSIVVANPADITYVPDVLVASFAIAVCASFAALWLLFRLRTGSSRLIR